MVKRKQKAEPSQVRVNRNRKRHAIPLRKRYLICTEGKTEAIYFGHYKSSTGPIVVSLNKSDHKLGLVKKTIEEKNTRIQNNEFEKEIDEVWVVMDRDEELSKRYDKTHFNQALKLAAANNIFVAYSNDAFELWLLYHYQDLSTPTHRKELVKKLKIHRKKKYEKADDLYHEIKPSRLKAIDRATKSLKTGRPPESANPSTTVYQLVNKLMNEPGYREE